MLCLDSYCHFELPGFQSSASIPPICDIPLTEVNRKLYAEHYEADSSEADRSS